MILYRTAAGPVLAKGDRLLAIARDWHELVNDDALHDSLLRHCRETRDHDPALADHVRRPLPPIGERQELWAAGVTWYRSRTARMEESQSAGGSDFYDRVYDAERPELFLKATPHRVVGPGESLRLRADSAWIVPEPELVLVITRTGRIVGFTVGNDLSCRDIEGENPLYLPQAKVFDRCASLGPGILVAPEPPGPETEIRMTIDRGDERVFEGASALSQMKRRPGELVDFLFRENSHPEGCMLMTGTGIVPPAEFSLEPGDLVSITIDGIGTLANPVHRVPA
ncbi:MAG TPA: fumarylacetoacetate hydrolase family protein [Woeseiaceae bacterium]|nr:fumarylacetoacetate hydrolase family protein [Woeseiaceae bacterium]